MRSTQLYSGKQQLIVGMLLTLTLSFLVESGEANAISGNKTEPQQATFANHCLTDRNLVGPWVQDQRIFEKYDLCVGPFRIMQASMPKLKPKTQTTPSTKLSDVSQCKITNDPKVNIVRAFPNGNQGTLEDEFHPSPNTTYQVVPLFSKDAPNPKGRRPIDDYGKYFEFIQTWTKYISDGSSNVTFKVPNSYIEFPGKIAKYKVGHKNHDDPGHIAFAEAVGKVIQGKVDINSADVVLIVVPAGTDLGVIEQGPVPLIQGRNPHRNSTALSPALTSQNADPKYNLWFSHPLGVLHELFHIGPGLEDHVGKAHGNKWIVKKGDEVGTGEWGLMSTGKTDLLAWEKWYLGFMMDSQVRCVTSNSTTTHWIAPSTIKTSLSKLLVIPTGEHEALIVESMRAKGLNYKIPAFAEGAMVYYLNASEPRRDFAYELLGPKNRTIKTNSFLLADWTLKKGESLKFKGIHLQVIEAGEYGDVIKVTVNR